MKRSKESNRTCPNPNCCLKGRLGKGNIIRHSFYITRQGRRRRYRCKECGRTFSSTRGTPYYRLHKPRSLFDEVVRMCVHGIAISAMARIKRMAWGTIARWLESAATYAVRFNDRMLRGFVIHELQADEIRTFVGAKKRVIWVLTTLEVWSRLWVSTNVGRRSLQQIKNAILNTLQRGLLKHRFLFTTDGFEMYEWAAKRLLLGVCIYGQVIKKRRENRVVRVDRRLLLGTQGELEEALFHSEDSSTLNTSFVERHNLTIRQGCSYLGRRTPCHARRTEFWCFTLQPRGPQLLVHPRTTTQIGVQDLIRAGKLQQTLPILINRLTKQRPPKLLPVAPPVPQLHVPPLLIPVLIGPPGRFPDPGDKALQIVIELARHEVAHPQCLQVRHQLLIEKAAVRPHDDGHVLPVVPANLLDQMSASSVPPKRSTLWCFFREVLLRAEDFRPKAA